MLTFERKRKFWSKYSKSVIFGLGLLTASSAQASDFNADAVLNNLNEEQRSSYMMGLVDGLAYARWLKDKPSEVGMRCIYDWYYQNNAALWKSTLLPAFETHGDKPVTAILFVLSKRKCGE